MPFNRNRLLLTSSLSLLLPRLTFVWLLSIVKIYKVDRLRPLPPTFFFFFLFFLYCYYSRSTHTALLFSLPIRPIFILSLHPDPYFVHKYTHRIPAHTLTVSLSLAWLLYTSSSYSPHHTSHLIPHTSSLDLYRLR